MNQPNLNNISSNQNVLAIADLSLIILDINTLTTNTESALEIKKVLAFLRWKYRDEVFIKFDDLDILVSELRVEYLEYLQKEN